MFPSVRKLFIDFGDWMGVSGGGELEPFLLPLLDSPQLETIYYLNMKHGQFGYDFLYDQREQSVQKLNTSVREANSVSQPLCVCLDKEEFQDMWLEVEKDLIGWNENDFGFLRGYRDMLTARERYEAYLSISSQYN